MAKLMDYLDPSTLKQLEEAFSTAAGARVTVQSPEGRPLWSALAPAAAEGEASALAGDLPAERQSPVMIDGELAGRVVVAGPGGAPRGLLDLMAQTVARTCEGQKLIRGRAEELALLFSLTAEFTSQRDLQGVLDLVAKTVVRALKGKACSIRLLNEERTELMIKSVANLSPQYLSKGPILVSASQIDREVIETGRPVYIADERLDERVLYKKEANEEGIVSALCAPLMYKGRPEGVIRVYTGQQHVFDWFEIAVLQTIAAQAAAAIVNARLVLDAVQTADIKRQLKTAAEVQRRLTPSQPPSIPGIEIGTIYVPCFELGGDFYDFIDLPPDNMGVAICDVAGKGIPASLLMASIRASLRAHAANIYDMAEVLERVNRDLCADTKVSSFATLFYGVIDYKTRRFTYANGGHVPPILVRDGTCCDLSTGGGVLGINRNDRWRHEHFVLKSGDVVLACTDGLTEAVGAGDEEFGRKRVQDATLAGIAGKMSAAGIARHVLWEMRHFAGLQNEFDDLTVMVIKVL